MKNASYSRALDKSKNLFRQLLASKLFLRNLLFIGAIMLAFFAVFAISTYRQSKTILFEEFSASSKYQLEMTADAVDTHIKDMRYVIATLDQNSMVRAFFSHKDPETLYSSYTKRIQELLLSYTYSFSSIDSIYLYSELSDSVISANTLTAFSSFQDRGWAEYLTDESLNKNMLLFPRAKNGSFPYLLCIMKPLEINGYKAAIILNLNLSKIAHLTTAYSSPYQEVYLVSDDLQVLFSHNQRALLESIDSLPKLEGFRPADTAVAEVYSDLSEHFVLAQVHSKDCPWYYVTITNLDAYTDLLSGNSIFLTVLFLLLFLAAMVISLVFSIRSVKPIHELVMLIDGPALPGKPPCENEVEYVSQKIVSFAQQNRELADELADQLNLLNESRLLALQSQINPHFLFNTLNMIYTYECEELGYQHELPAMTLSLSRLLRYAFQSTDLVSLDTELEFTKIYLTLMRRRYNDLFRVEYHISSQALSANVPKLFIQPIVENAIFHGLSDSRSPDPCLKLFIEEKDGVFMVQVNDNGAGMDAESLERLRNIADEQLPKDTGIGVKNVIIRMKLLYGDRFTMDIRSAPGEGTTFTLQFPILRPST